MTVSERIRDFLAQKRLAVVGVSHQPNDFSRVLFREFRKRGYDAVPVNPNAREIDGERCFARVQDIDRPVDGVLLMTSSRVTQSVVRDCAEAGIKRIWMYRASGKGAVEPAAVAFCQEHGMSVVPGECPFMFLSGGAWVHRMHALVKKVVGSYPK